MPKRLLSLLICGSILAPIAAMAQPAPEPPPPPAPSPPPPPPPPPPPYVPPPPVYPAVQPAYVIVEPPGPDRSGFTFELGLGLGVTVGSIDRSHEPFGGSGLAGLNAGIGGWMSRTTALTVRVASTHFDEEVAIGPYVEERQFLSAWAGPSVQLMISDNAFVGGGAGWSVLNEKTRDKGEVAFGLDLRAGFNFHQSRKHAFGVQVEATHGFFENVSLTGVGLLIGWQYL